MKPWIRTLALVLTLAAVSAAGLATTFGSEATRIAYGPSLDPHGATLA